MSKMMTGFPITEFQDERIGDLAKRYRVPREAIVQDIAQDLSDALNHELDRRERIANGTVIKPGKNRTGEVQEITLQMLQRIPDVDNKLAALERLIEIAKSDTGQSRKVADFLLAWWNAQDCGAFDLTTLWQVDATIADDMIAVCGLIARLHSYPDSLGYKPVFQRIVKDWRNVEAE